MKLGFSDTERTTWDPELTALLFNLGGGTKVIDSSAETDENNCQDLISLFLKTSWLDTFYYTQLYFKSCPSDLMDAG